VVRDHERPRGQELRQQLVDTALIDFPVDLLSIAVAVGVAVLDPVGVPDLALPGTDLIDQFFCRQSSPNQLPHKLKQ
jgi:hypothetical protein